MTGSPSYLVLASTPWAARVFANRLQSLPGTWNIATRPEEVTPEGLAADPPDMIFSLHWSWRVPTRICETYECICFHMTDVPYGRGGSPLQNLIVRGHAATKLSALRMTPELDAGPVYLKRDLDLSGTAAEIYDRAMDTAADMIEEILAQKPDPIPQQGTPTFFTRRTPDQSDMSRITSLAGCYDFIRMLDADGYPKAFIDTGTLRLEFSAAEFANDTVTATVTIHTLKEDAS